MATLVVPTASDRADYTERVTLEGIQYVFRFRWNTRMAAWFMDISDDVGNLISAGRRCVADSPITVQRRPIAGMPQGQFVPFDTSRRQEDPRFEDFGSRVLLTYVETTE